MYYISCGRYMIFSLDNYLLISPASYYIRGKSREWIRCHLSLICRHSLSPMLHTVQQTWMSLPVIVLSDFANFSGPNVVYLRQHISQHLNPYLAVISTNTGSLLIGSLGTNAYEINAIIRRFSFKKMHSNCLLQKGGNFLLVAINQEDYMARMCANYMQKEHDFIVKSNEKFSQASFHYT